MNNLIYNLSCILVSAILYKNDETNKKLLYLKIWKNLKIFLGLHATAAFIQQSDDTHFGLKLY